MAIEYLGSRKRKRLRQSTSVSFPITVDYEALQLLQETMVNKEVGRSDAVKQLIRAGHTYLFIVKPEQFKRIEDQKVEDKRKDNQRSVLARLFDLDALLITNNVVSQTEEKDLSGFSKGEND